MKTCPIISAGNCVSSLPVEFSPATNISIGGHNLKSQGNRWPLKAAQMPSNSQELQPNYTFQKAKMIKQIRSHCNNTVIIG